MASVFCTKCGSPLPEGAKFCTACGAMAPAPSSQGTPVSAPVTEGPTPEPVQTIETIHEQAAENAYAIPAESEPATAQSPARSQTYSEPAQTWQPINSPPPPQYVQQPVSQTPPRPVQAPVYQQPSQQWQPPAQQPVKQAAPAYSAPPAAYPASTIGAWGYFGSLLLMSIPLVGLIASIIWAAGSKNINRRNLARGYLLLLIIGIIIFVAVSIISSILMRDTISRIFESIFPGYTIEW